MNLARILPWLIPFLVETLVRLNLPFLGRLLGLFQNPINDREALAKLNESQNWRPKRRSGYTDSSHVVKVSDAIACVQNQVNNRNHWIAIAKELVRSLVGTPRNSMVDFGESVADCIREKSLEQSSERLRRPTRTGLHRPAIGHGHGRNFS